MRIYHLNFKSSHLKNERRKLKSDSPSAVRSAHKSWPSPSSAPTTSPRNKRKAKAELKTVSMLQSPRPCDNSSRRRESSNALGSVLYPQITQIYKSMCVICGYCFIDRSC